MPLTPQAIYNDVVNNELDKASAVELLMMLARSTSGKIVIQFLRIGLLLLRLLPPVNFWSLI